MNGHEIKHRGLVRITYVLLSLSLTMCHREVDVVGLVDDDNRIRKWML